MQKKPGGFTLVELLVAVTIVAVLSAIGFTVFSNSQVVARDSRRKQDLKTYKTSFELFYQKHQFFPSYDTNSQGSSLSANWPNLFQYVYMAGSPAVDPAEKTSDYIAQIPLDPVNNGNFRYNYYVQAGGQGYLICTTLENSKDPSNNLATWGPGQNYCERAP